MATVYWREWNGDPGDPTSKEGQNIQFKRSDDPEVEDLETATNNMVRPNAGVVRSYEKYLRLYLEDLDGLTSISNLRAYISGTPPANGVGIFCKTSAAYEEPLSGGHLIGGAMIGPKDDLFTKTADDPIVLGAGPFEDALEDIGDFLVMQLELYPSVAIGLVSGQFQLLVSWDEEE